MGMDNEHDREICSIKGRITISYSSDRLQISRPSFRYGDRLHARVARDHSLGPSTPSSLIEIR